MNFCDTYNNRRLFCSGWEFFKAPFGSEYSDGFDFRAVDLPHDWLIYNTNNLYETSTGWYRKSFSYEKKPGVRTYIRFDGVYMDSHVYINGKTAGEWKYGYSAFQFDITDLVVNGENTITVRVDHRAPNSRWYSGAGIYRSVWLCESPEMRFGNDGVYISTEKNGEDWTVTVTSEVLRPAGTPIAGIRLRQTVLDPDGNAAASAESDACAADFSCIPEAVRVDGASYSVTTQNLRVDSPALWDIESPKLYTLVSEIISGGDVVQRISQRFGFRTAEFTTDRGFFLNGRHVKLHGSCEHHDNGCLGAVSNRAAILRRFRKLREMGVNAIRTSHNMPAQEFMELADEFGMLILSEGFDMWERSKTDYDYARFFDVPVETVRISSDPNPYALPATQRTGIVYAGNLGLNRIAPLVELGRALRQAALPGFSAIDVYSGEQRPAVLRQITEENGLHYCGRISASEVERLLGRSKFLVFTESFDDKSVRRVKYSLSTKISESLRSGACLLAYGSPQIASIEYLRRHNAARILRSADELPAALLELCSSHDTYAKYVRAAQELAEQCHNQERNDFLMCRIFRNAIENAASGQENLEK